MKSEDLKKEVEEIFKAKTGAVSIKENKKVQAMIDSIIEAIAPYLEKSTIDAQEEKVKSKSGGLFSRFFN